MMFAYYSKRNFPRKKENSEKRRGKIVWQKHFKYILINNILDNRQGAHKIGRRNPNDIRGSCVMQSIPGTHTVNNIFSN